MESRNIFDDYGDDYGDDYEEPYSFYEASCTACERYGAVNELRLCNACSAKMDRDFMRQRNWEYSTTAFGLTIAGREEVRRLIIKQYGEPLELLTSGRNGRNNSNDNNTANKKRGK